MNALLSRALGGVVAAAALSTLAACGTDTPATPDAPTDSPTNVAAPQRQHPAEMLIAPGRVGAARAGMTRAEWRRTGLFAPGPVLCSEPIHWRSDRTGRRLFVYTRGTTITQLSVKAPGPHTADGLEVGSTYAEVRAVYGDALSAPAHDGWDDRTQVYVRGEEDGRTYLAFEFRGARVTASSKVDEIAVTDGDRPGFMYDC